MRGWFVAFASVAVLLSGCGPGSYSDFRRGLVGASCEWAQKCGYVDSSDRADCPLDDVLAIFGDTSMERAAAGAFDVEGSIGAGRMRYDSVSAGNCEDAVRGAACDPTLGARKRLSACNAVVSADTATGKVCYADAECTGGICVHSAGCAGSCVAYAPFNTPCDPLENSDDNRVAPIASRCDPSVGFCGPPSPGKTPACQPKKPKGSACDDTDQCDFGWDCRQGKCVDPIALGVGQPCGGEDPCGSGKFCDPTTVTCASQQKRGQACVSPLGCKDGLACIGLEPVAVSGTPTAVTTPGVCGAWLGIGAACAAGTTGTVTGCPSRSSTCTGGVCTEGTHAAAFSASCAMQSCAPGFGCNAGGACDFLVAALGECNGGRTKLCEPGLACATSGKDQGRCLPPGAAACFITPDEDAGTSDDGDLM